MNCVFDTTGVMMPGLDSGRMSVLGLSRRATCGSGNACRQLPKSGCWSRFVVDMTSRAVARHAALPRCVLAGQLTSGIHSVMMGRRSRG